MAKVSMRDMLEAGVHFGHQTRFWNPQMAPYIFGERNKIHIINLEKTYPMFHDAANYVGKLAARKGKILFVGTKRAAQTIIQEEATRSGMPYINHRWLGGTLTNFSTIKNSVKRLKDLELQETDGTIEKLTKKEALMMSRERQKLDRALAGIKDMNVLPDALFVIDVGFEKIAIKEANKLGIPVIAVVDTNHSAKGVDYVIPGNDDAVRAIRLYAAAMADAVLDSKGLDIQLADAEKSTDEFIEVAENSDATEAEAAPATEASPEAEAAPVVEPEPAADAKA